MTASRRVAPGIWIDAAGAVHFSIPELLAHFDLPQDLEHEEWMRELLVRAVREWRGPDVTLIRHDACPACAAKGMEPHSSWCPFR